MFRDTVLLKIVVPVVVEKALFSTPRLLERYECEF